MVVVRSRTMVVSMPVGMVALMDGKLRANPVDSLDDVGAGLAEDDDGNRALAVQISGGADVLHRVGDLRDVGQADGCAVVIADDERLVVVGVRDLIVGENVGGHQAVGDLAFGQVGVLQAQGGLQTRKRNPIAGQLGGVCVHPHGRQGAASGD